MINGCSLFSNCGIAELMLPDSLKIVVANELIRKRSNYYKVLHPETNMICGDILDNDIFDSVVKESLRNDVKFLIATPPCQGVSLIGRRDMLDKRNFLTLRVIDYCKIVYPDYVLIENVMQINKVMINGVDLANHLKTEFDKLGYNVEYDVLDCSEYGVPQKRKRLFYRIYRKGLSWELPNKEKIVTVGEAIGHLPSLEAGCDSGIKYHKALDVANKQLIECIKHTPTGKSAMDNLDFYPKTNGRRIKAFRSTYKRTYFDKPHHTITTTNTTISSGANCHYGRLLANGLYSDARVLTLLELMILHTIPVDKIVVNDTYTEHFVRKLIGESIPPLMVRKLFDKILDKV